MDATCRSKRPKFQTCANASAGTPDKQARTAWEMAKVLQRFRAIDDEDLFFRTFPLAGALHGRGLPLAALLAVQAVQAEESCTRNFGLDLLYELLGEPAMAERLEAIGFGYPRLFKFAALAADRWALDEAANWRAAHASLEAALAERDAAYDWQVGQVESWKAAYEAQTREVEKLRAAYAVETSRGLRGLLRRLRPGPAGRS